MAACLQVGSGLATASAAGPIAYEGFDYPAGSTLSGKKGGIGWSNGWVDVSGNQGVTVSSDGLVAGSNAPIGYDNRSTGNSVYVGNGSRCGRWLD